MADPLTALNLASRIVRFINFADGLIDTESGDATSVKHAELETVTKNLVDLNDGMKFRITRYREEVDSDQKKHAGFRDRLRYVRHGDLQADEHEKLESPVDDPDHKKHNGFKDRLKAARHGEWHSDHNDKLESPDDDLDHEKHAGLRDRLREARHRDWNGDRSDKALSPDELKDRDHEDALRDIEESLSKLCNDCNNAAQELLGAVSDLKAKVSSQTWNSFREALGSVWSGSAIESFSVRLGEYRLQIGAVMMASLHLYFQYNEADGYATLLGESKASMDKENQRHQKRIDEIHDKHDQQAHEKPDFSPVELQALEAEQVQRAEASRRHYYQHDVLETLRKQDWPHQTRLDAKYFSSLLTETATKQKDAIIQKQILERLKFHDMRDRFIRISRAHKETFEWVFLGPEHQDGVTGATKGRQCDSPEPMDGPASRSADKDPDAVSEATLTENQSTLSTKGVDHDTVEEQDQASSKDFTKWWNIAYRAFSVRHLKKAARSPHWDNYREWLRGDQKLYWITGKPGSGKSTLMKLLYEDRRLVKHLKTWVGDSELCTAGFFFWNSGTVMQMSKQGLLRALLYEALNARPDLSPEIVASMFPDRWQYHAQFGPNVHDWSLGELEDAFRNLVCDRSKKYFFMIDGLDEYEGDPKELANFLLECCSNGQNVKMCVASRPLPEFESVFGRRPSLSMERLTASDIEKYTSDKFHANETFANFREKQPEKSEKLVQRITEKAEGGFLWAQLVTNYLLGGLQEGDTLEELEKRLDGLPPGLKPLYERIWSHLQQGDFQRSCRLFRLFREANTPMSLLSLYFADEGPEKAFSDTFQCATQQELDSFAKTMLRQLGSLCANMIEAPTFKDDGAWAKVEYMHKSVKDFLNNGETVDSINNGSTESTEDIDLALCTGFLRAVKKLDPSGPPPFERYQDLVYNCLRFSKKIEQDDSQTNLRILVDLDKAAGNVVGRRNPDHEKWRKRIQSLVPLTREPHWTNACDMRTGSSNFFDFAFRIGFYSYVEHSLKESQYYANPEPLQSNLLVVAILNDKIDIKLAKLLLEYKANPNHPGDFAEFKTPWYLLLSNMATGIGENTNLSAHERERLGEFAKLFLEYGADPFITVREWKADQIIEQVVGDADQVLSKQITDLLEERRKRNPQLKPKKNRLARLKKFLKS